MITYKSECIELGFPEPRTFDNQQSYIIYCISNDHTMNTRQARYIGIGNLHTQASNIKKKGHKITVDKVKARCIKTSIILPHPVDIVYMTGQQQKEYWEGKKKPIKN